MGHGLAQWIRQGVAAAKRQRTLLWVGLVLVSLILSGDCFLLTFLKRQAITEAFRATRNLAYVLAEQTDRSLQAVDIVTDAVAAHFEGLGITSAAEFEAIASEPSVTAFLKEKMSGLQHVGEIHLTSARGRPVISSRGDQSPRPDLDLSQREYVQRANALEGDDLIITKPFRRTTGEWAIILAKRIASPSGVTVGIVSAILETERIEKLYANLLLGPNTAISMHRTDGTLLLRYPRSEKMIGMSLAGADAFKQLVANRQNGVLQARSPIDGSQRIIGAFAAPNFPLVTVVAASLEDVLSDWEQTKAWLIGGGAFAGIAIGFLVMFLAGSAENLADAKAALAVAHQREVAEAAQREQQDKLVHLARHDPLTGLPNRFHFHEELATRIAMLLATEQAAVHYIDLDRFKSINDTFGHAAGDDLLIRVAERLRSAIRPSDFLARLGGDEFVVIQHLQDGPPAAAALAKRIVTRMQEAIPLQHGAAAIGASIGISIAGPTSLADDVIKEADLALYAAKGNGRKTFEFFRSAFLEAATERVAIEQQMNAANIAHDFELYFQPQVDLKTGNVLGFEALVRWNHPEKGCVSPADFIPIAEETGMIGPLGEWIIAEACMIAATWPTDLKVAVNVSAAQFNSTDVPRIIRLGLDRSGMAPCRLEIEVTESLILSESERAIPALYEIKSMGVSVALDDFGTGYSSLSCLTQFPFDKLKIDQSFVRELGARDDCHAIVQAATALATRMKIRTTAEGIENARQLLEARALGCLEGQGYLFGKPMRAVDASQLIADRAIRNFA